MMLASVGQAASYAQHSASSAVGGGVSNTSQKAQQSHNRPLLASTNHNNNNKFNNNNSGSSRPTATATTTSLMKTLAVRLHRGTEFIKDTVQRALVDSTVTKAACSTSASASTSSSSTSSSYPKEVHTTKTTIAAATVTTTSSSTSAKQQTKGLNKDLHQNQHHHHQYKYHSKSNLNKIPPPTALHRLTEARQNASSTDSLLKELCHFKPIRPMPLTRNKLGNKPPGCDIKTPKFILATKKNIAFDSTYKATGPSFSDSSSSNNLPNQNLHQQSVLKLAASNTTKASQTIQRQPQYKSAFVCLKINANEIIKAKQQSKGHSYSNDKKEKPRRRRRRNAFGVPRRRGRNKKLMDEIEDATEDSSNQTVRNIDTPQPKKRTYQRKRKTIETNKQLIQEGMSVAAPNDNDDDDDPISNLQPTKSKRKRLTTKDWPAMKDELNVSSSVKNVGVGVKTNLMNAKLVERKKIPTSSSIIRKTNETLRRSPPMTRQRARQISYNQSK